MYTEKVIAEFTNPEYVGEIADADGVGEVENPGCGDIMRRIGIAERQPERPVRLFGGKPRREQDVRGLRRPRRAGAPGRCAYTVGVEQEQDRLPLNVAETEVRIVCEPFDRVAV